MRFIIPLMIALVASIFLWFSRDKEPQWQVPVGISLQEYLFSSEEGGPKTNALLIWKDGEIVTERYGRGYDSDSPHLLWSISKSITSTLIGVAIQEGRLEVEDTLDSFFNLPTLEEDPAKKGITVDHLLLMSSGLNWQETYEYTGDRTESSVGQMHYGLKSSDDMVDYTLSHPLIEAPGTRYNYSTGDATVLVNVLKSVYGDEFSEMPWTKLFDVLGMEKVTFEKDQSNQFIGGSSIYMRASDLVRFAELHLNQGQWNGQQILPPQWNDFVWSPNSVFYQNSSRKHNFTPGRHWWTNFHPEDPKKLAFDSLPADTVFGLGHWGQYLIIIPSMNVVVVRLGEDQKIGMNEEFFFKLVAQEIERL